MLAKRLAQDLKTFKRPQDKTILKRGKPGDILPKQELDEASLGSDAADFGRGALQGATLGYGENMAAWLRSKQPWGKKMSYDQALAAEKAENKAAQERSPWLYGAGEYGAMLAPGLAGLKAAKAAGSLATKAAAASWKPAAAGLAATVAASAAKDEMDAQSAERLAQEKQKQDAAKPAQPAVEKPAAQTPQTQKPAVTKPEGYTQTMGKVGDIASQNQIANPNKIQTGQTITLPDGSNYTVARGDTLYNIARGNFKGETPVAAALPSDSESVSEMKKIKPKFKQDRLTPHEKFKGSVKRAGYDMDAGANRLLKLLDKQARERAERDTDTVKESEHKRTFNDDDFYAYDPKTMKIMSDWSNKSVGRWHQEHEAKEKGWEVVRGMRAKHMDLQEWVSDREWHNPQPAMSTMEGAKVDRMVKHIEKSERATGKSKKEAENIAWATANKRGYLDNKNKKKHVSENTASKIPVNDYDLWRDKIEAARGEIYPQKDRVHLVAQSWDGETIGEFNLRTNQGFITNNVKEAANPAQQAAIAVNMKKHHQKPKTESRDSAEYDDESGMAHNQLKSIARAVHGLADTIRDGDNLPEWVQKKLSLAEDDLVTIWNYLQGEKSDEIMEQGVTEGKGDFAQAIENLHGWYEEESSNPNIRVWEFDDREGGYYAQGTVYYDVKTGRVKIKFEDRDGYHGGDVNDTFNSIGDAMNVLKNITVQIRPNTGKARDFDKLGGRTLAGPDDLYKTDREGRKGTLNKRRMGTMKASSPYRKTGPEGILPEQQGVSEAQACPECGGAAYDNEILAEEKDACYSKVKSRYKVWPSAYASGALVKCRKVGAKNWGNKSKKK